MNHTVEGLPPAEKTQLSLGYMRLSDSAPLIIAKQKGFFERYGLSVQLEREVSWANIRDKVIAGQLDAAQMLSPLPLVTTLGVTGIRSNMLTGLVLSLHGNGITLSPQLAEQFSEESKGGVSLDRPITLATVHLFSMHTLFLRRWCLANGIDPDRDMRIIVLPPEQMVDSLTQGLMDGFCVGEPWNTVAVTYGVGAIVANAHELMGQAPEKVLGVAEGWHSRNPATHLRLRLAVMEAQSWLRNMDNRPEAVELIAATEYLDLPREYLLPSLTGRLCYQRDQEPVEVSQFHVFSRYDAGFPWRCEAEAILQQCGEQLGKPLMPEKYQALAQQCFRTDLYREAARWLKMDAPESDRR